MKPSEWFETRKRTSAASDGETFVTLRDGAPQWIVDAVHEAHGTDMPDDWTWAECRAAAEAWESGEILDGDTHNHADSRVNVYTRALFDWAAEHQAGDIYVMAQDDASDMGCEGTPEEQFRVIQYCAIARIASVMAEACSEAETADCSEEE